MKKIVKSISLIISIVLLVGFAFGQVVTQREAGVVYADGGIEVDFESDNWPFYEENFVPGDFTSKEVTVKNISGRKQKVAMKMSKTRGWVLAAPLFIEISDKNTGKVYFGGKVPRSLLETYLWPCEISLFDLQSKQQKDLTVKITFWPQAGNEFQGLSTRFDFSLGFIGRRATPPPPSWWPFPWWPFPF